MLPPVRRYARAGTLLCNRCWKLRRDRGGLPLWVHPSCAFSAGHVLASCAHFGAELYYVMCAEHSKEPHRHRPTPPERPLLLPTTSTLDASQHVARGEATTDGGPLGSHDAGHARYSSSACKDSRASKLARLSKLAHESGTLAPVGDGEAHEDGGVMSAWWWALRPDLVPPAADAAQCSMGSVRRGGDGRKWRVCLASASGTVDVSKLTVASREEASEAASEAHGDATTVGVAVWMPLNAEGAIARPSQLPPPPPATRPSGLPGRFTKRPLDRESEYLSFADHDVHIDNRDAARPNASRGGRGGGRGGGRVRGRMQSTSPGALKVKLKMSRNGEGSRAVELGLADFLDRYAPIID